MFRIIAAIIEHIRISAAVLSMFLQPLYGHPLLNT
jgi:hypothetical protein